VENIIVEVEEIVARLEEFILERAFKTELPSIAVSLIIDGEVVYERGFGYRDVENRLPASPRTVYGIGSVTKSFTALAVMQLYEKGLLSPDDPAEKFLPFKLRAKGEPVKIHHLLTHSSGIPALAYAEALIRGLVGEAEYWLPVISYEDLFAFLRKAADWAVAKPGEKFFYLNEGYVLLGYIVEKVSGVKYEEYVKKNIFEPLEMNDTLFIGDSLEGKEAAVPYVIHEGERIRRSYPQGITADGGILSCVKDLSNYLLMYMNGGVFKEKEIVSEKTIREMTEPHVPIPYSIFEKDGYGYGWRITGLFGHKLVRHSGSILVSTAFAGYLPEKKTGVVVLANASGYPLSFIGMYALTLALDKEPEEELYFIKADRILDRLQGIYETYRGTMRVNVVRRGDVLYLERKGKYTSLNIPLILDRIEENKAVFKAPGIASKLEVEFYIEDSKVEMFYERYKLVKKQ